MSVVGKGGGQAQLRRSQARISQNIHRKLRDGAVGNPKKNVNEACLVAMEEESERS
jgi:hypothetical protein